MQCTCTGSAHACTCSAHAVHMHMQCTRTCSAQGHGVLLRFGRGGWPRWMRAESRTCCPLVQGLNGEARLAPGRVVLDAREPTARLRTADGMVELCEAHLVRAVRVRCACGVYAVHMRCTCSAAHGLLGRRAGMRLTIGETEAERDAVDGLGTAEERAASSASNCSFSVIQGGASRGSRPCTPSSSAAAAAGSAAAGGAAGSAAAVSAAAGSAAAVSAAAAASDAAAPVVARTAASTAAAKAS